MKLYMLFFAIGLFSLQCFSEESNSLSSYENERQGKVAKKSFQVVIHNYSNSFSSEDLLVEVSLRCIQPTSSPSLGQIWGEEPNYSTIDCGQKIFRGKLDKNGVFVVPDMQFFESKNLNRYSFRIALVTEKGGFYRVFRISDENVYYLMDQKVLDKTKFDFSLFELPSINLNILPPPGVGNAWHAHNTISTMVQVAESKSEFRLPMLIFSSGSFIQGAYVVFAGDFGMNPLVRLRLEHRDLYHHKPNPKPYDEACPKVPLIDKVIKLSELPSYLSRDYQAKKTVCD